MAGGRLILPLSAAILAALASASPSGLLVADAQAQVARRPDDEHQDDAPLLLAVAMPSGENLLAHQSHSSHASHASHSSHYSGSGGGGGDYGGGGGGDYGGGGGTQTPAPYQPPPPPPPKPGRVSFVAFPGGKITVDGNVAGHDSTGTLSLAPGSHSVVVENRFLGRYVATIDISDGQTGVITIDW